VLQDSPAFYYRFNEASGTVVHDSSGNFASGNYYGSIDFGLAGILVDDPGTAVGLDGSTSYATTNNTYPNPQTFSEEIWFKSTSTIGGVIISGTSAAGSSITSDRTLFMNSSGALYFTWRIQRIPYIAIFLSTVGVAGMTDVLTVLL